MFISVITVCFNSEATIGQCIESVRNQKFQDFEHIIIDGGSSDRTIEILNEQMHSKMRVVSEPDEGIYDAMNKGIRIAEGCVVHFLNSDDFYANDGILLEVYNAFSDGVNIVIGNVDYGSEAKPNVWRVSEPNLLKISLGWHPPHPSFFCTRSCFKEYGLFDETISISADFELMMRFIKKNINQTTCLNTTTTYMSPGGVSSTLKSTFIGNWNVLKAAYKLRLSIFLPLYLFFRLTPKAKRKFRSLVRF